jgi:predicted O-methyltransferase YrrM
MKKTVENRAQRLITDKATEDYLDSLCPGNRVVLENIRKRAEEDDIPIIRRTSEELLKTILTMHTPERILEIGTAVGYSALVMAETLPQADIVTLEIGSTDYMKALDNFALYAGDTGLRYPAEAGRPPESRNPSLTAVNMPETDILRIEALHIDADDYLAQAVKDGRKFDFVFLDAAKAQYIIWLPDIMRLLSEGGVLFADNVLLDGTIPLSRYALDRRDRTTHQRMRDFLYAITHEPRLVSAVVPSGDGVSISVYHEHQDRTC